MIRHGCLYFSISNGHGHVWWRTRHDTDVKLHATNALQELDLRLPEDRDTRM